MGAIYLDHNATTPLRAEVLDAMTAALRDAGWDVATADGINLWLRVDDERDAVVQLAASGIRVAAGTPFLTTPGGQFIRVTVGQIRDDFAAVGAQLALAGTTT